MAAGRKDSYRKQQEQLQKDKYDINQVGLRGGIIQACSHLLLQ
jgi:hypothetical protein